MRMVWQLNPPAMRARQRSWTMSGAYWPTRFSARSSCTGFSAGWCRSWHPAITSAGCCPLVHSVTGEGRRPSRASSRGGVHGRSRLDRRFAHRSGAWRAASLTRGKMPALGVHHLEAPPAGAATRARPAAVSARGAAGLGRPHHAHRGARDWALRNSRARPATMRRGRPLIRPRSCWVCHIPAVPSLRGSPSAGGQGCSASRARCSIAPGSNSVSRPQNRRAARDARPGDDRLR